MAELTFGEVTEQDKKKEELVNMLIQFFNFQKGTHYKWGNQTNRVAVTEAIERANNDIALLKNYIRQSEGTDLVEVFESFNINTYHLPVPEVKELSSTQQQTSNYMGLLEKAVVELIAKTNAKEIEEKVFDNLENQVRDFIKSEYGTIERKVNTVVNGIKVEMEGVQHDQFETVLKFVSNNEPVFLTGPAGSGKNVLCQQVAKALGLNFYFSNAVTQEYKITGFTDAMGVFHESQFYKAFKNGGVFMLDEIDASIPEVLVILNAALANRYFDFPAPIGYVEAHPDFRVKIDYSEAIENNVACGDTELVRFARDFRKASAKTGARVIFSYRSIGRIAKMKQILPLNEVLKTCLVKGMEKDDLNMLVKEMKVENEYKRTLQKIVEEM